MSLKIYYYYYYVYILLATVLQSLTGGCCRFSTFFHKLLSQGNRPQLQVRLAHKLLEKELRVLYRIGQLTGVLLEESVVSQGLNVSHLMGIPPFDQREVQAARRSLHG